MTARSNLQLLFIFIALLMVTSCCLNEGKNPKQMHSKLNHTKKNVEYKIKGMFVFGTSVVDNGNNNYIKGSLGKVNYTPYGTDFPLGPTGRFSNGDNVADCIGRLIGLDSYIPPFLNPDTKGDRILYGVNFGSGGSGILDSTGSITGGVITLNEQIKKFEEVTLPELKKLVLEPKVTNLQIQMQMQIQMLNRYLFVIAAGNNDLGLNYFLQNSSSRPPLPAFVSNLTSTYATQLQRLYKVGARKFALLTLYPLGCSPVTKQSSNNQQCVSTANAAAKYVNTQLISMVDALKQKLAGSQFVVVNTYKIILDIIHNPSATGFRNVTGPCCELKDIMGAKITCKEGGKICKDRNAYVYFDGQHNTEAVNKVIAEKAFFSDCKTEAYPFNLQSLAML